MNEQKKQITSPVKAIRAKCLDCCCDSANEVKLCELDSCPLWEFRFGKNPYISRNMSQEAKDAARERLRKFRESNGGNPDGTEKLS